MSCFSKNPYVAPEFFKKSNLIFMAQASNKKSGFDLSSLIIPIALIVSFLLYFYVFGNPDNFKDATKHEPKPGNVMGLIYLGGMIVPLLLTMFITTVAYSIERFLTIGRAKGTGSLDNFLRSVKSKLTNNDINGAIADCNKQKGSVANVVLSGLHKYAEMEGNNSLTTEQKVLNINKEIEEATTLELPTLEKNLPILATIASVATLVALLGTVLGMIRAFQAMAVAGTPDPTKLSAGISEALINTAIGIGTSAIAVIMYNIFTSKIDKLTYGIDEIGFSIAQTFAGKKH